jgi:4-methyl-5(b-hydroxyethyl)-thiazole monophosphate biosynthesis
MQKNIEKEYKVLITEKQFQILLNEYPDNKLKDQTNFYFDSYPSLFEKNIAIRIREIDRKHIFTLKYLNKNGDLEEYERELSKFDINDPSLKDIYDKFGIGTLFQIGKLNTQRYQIDDQFGSLCMDKSNYNGITDYEIEYELFNHRSDRLGRFKNILSKANIEYIPNTISKIVRMKNSMKEGINMKTVIFLAEGFETCEAFITVDMLKRANIEITTCTITNTNFVTSSQGVRIFADKVIADLKDNEYDCIILPGGMPGASNLQKCLSLEKMIIKFNQQNKLICAICAAPIILGELHLLKNKTVTCYPGFEDKCLGAKIVNRKVVKDGNIITGKAMGTTVEFASKIIETLTNKNTANDVLKQIYY